MKMKKFAALLIAALMIFSFAAAEELGTPTGLVTGGWTPSADPTVTEELKAIFDKGIEGLLGVGYTPVAYLGSQVVAGKNHAFLCQGITVHPGMEDKPAYYMVYLYEDLSGNVSVLSIAEFDIGALCTY